MDNMSHTDISVNDIRAMIGIIEIASKRGAFNDPKEFSAVGNLYNKLNNFVEYIENPKESAPTEEKESESKNKK